MVTAPGHFKRWVSGVVLCAVTVVSAPLSAQAPNEAWRTLTTEHFRVTFPEALEPLGRRAADRAERAWDELSEAFIDPPDDRIDLLVTDHYDRSNGFAGVTPSNRIVVYARPPVDAWSIGYSDEWLELVITHELAHIVHLDLSLNPIGRAVRSIFGRVSAEWPFFPELGTPRWVIEGLATWYESHLTQGGRVHGTFHDMQIRTAVLEGRFESIDQASGRSPQWPTGNRPYAYGSLFFDYLLHKHGQERMGAFVVAIARQWVPYRLDSAGRAAFGASLTDEWEAWRADLEAELADLDDRLAAHGPVTEGEAVGGTGRVAIHPEVSPDGRYLAFASADGNSDSEIRVKELATGEIRPIGRTNGTATFAWLPGNRLLLAQLDRDGPYDIWDDLYVRDLDGSERRLTRGARVSQPTVSPDGGTAIAVRQGGGTNSLVRVDIETGDITEWVAPDADVHWAYPSWSPDGRWVAATRWEPGGYHDIVLLDARSGAVVDRVSRDRALDLESTWSSDGRWLIWSSDRTGIINVLASEVAEDGHAGDPVLLTNVRTGAAYPAVDPQGEWLYFSGYHVDGWFVERTRFRPGGALEAPLAAPRFVAIGQGPRGSSTAEIESYSALPTVGPTYWEIVSTDKVVAASVRADSLVLPSRELLGVGLGIKTGGRDLVGRHAWGASASFAPAGEKLSAAASYVYGGLGNPQLSFSARQNWLSGGQTVAASGDTLFSIERERALAGGVTYLVPSWRRNLSFTLSGGIVWEAREVWDARLRPTTEFGLARPTARSHEVALSTTFSTSRSFAFQMGASKGLSVFGLARRASDATVPDSLAGVSGVDRSFDEVRGRVRAALPLWRTGYGRQVLAVQVAAGAARGPAAGIGLYRVGGASGEPENLTGLEAFGGSFIFFPVRGYAPTSRFGRYAWTASVDWRIPLWLGNHGFRAWPIHVDRSAVSLFFDAGNGWGPGISSDGFVNGRRSTLASVGGELTAEVLALFDVQLRLRGGVGVPLVEIPGSGVRGWFRVGLPF